MWFLITERVLVGWLPERWQRIAGGALAALIGATAFTVWNQSVVNEKVYTVSLARHRDRLVARWCAGATIRTDRRPIACSCSIAYLCGLGYANHMAGMLAAPAVAARGADPPPADAPALEAAARLRRRARPRHDAVRDAADPRRALPGDQRRRADRRAARSSSVDCTFSKATYDALHVQLQSRAVRQAGADASGRRRSRRRSACGGCTSSGSGCATRTTSIQFLQSAARRARSSCSACSADGCTGSATDEASGTSAR